MLCDPHVKIRISNGSYEIPVSQGLLCQCSPYFTTMFKGQFHESETQTTTLQAVDGVVSEQGFERLVLWLYTGRFMFETAVPSDRISGIIELARLSDMCGITTIQNQLVSVLLTTIVVNRSNDEPHTKLITSEHVRSAAQLPEDNPVFVKLAAAVAAGIVEGAGRSKFEKDSQLYPKFGAAVLLQVASILETLRPNDGGGHSMYTDPIFNGSKSVLSGKKRARKQ